MAEITEATKELRVKSYWADFTIIWFCIIFYHFNNYYNGFLTPITQSLLFTAGVGFSLVSIPYYRRSKSLSASKGLSFFRALRNWFIDLKSLSRNKFIKNSEVTKVELIKISLEDKHALLFFLVKFFFIPLMLEFLTGNVAGLKSSFTNLTNNGWHFSLLSFNTYLYPVFLSIFFIIDVGIGLFGYIFEGKKLNSVVRSVEPTALGWLVALLCYPPFNSITGGFLNGRADDNNRFLSESSTFILRVIMLGFWVIYTWGTVALGAKFSNLTNRGTVSKGPYRFVRHPAYAAKNIAWGLSIIPLLATSSFREGFLMVLAWLGVAFIYFMRAITEERHLLADPDYEKYCEVVKYRFIPGVI